jgi:hypothetical protein
MQNLLDHNEKFIMRASQNRKVFHDGKVSYINGIVDGLNCTHEMTFHSKTGNVSNCKIGLTTVTLPKLNNIQLTLIVCKEFGEKPLVLYTNLNEPIQTLPVRVVKAYLMCWRIEEYHAFKKQSFGFEGFRVRSLQAIRTLDLLLTIAIGYIGTVCEKADTELYVVELIAISKRIEKIKPYMKKTKFFCYAVLDGITLALSSLRCGISNFFAPNPPDAQLVLHGC